jgi:hypothetical protein
MKPYAILSSALLAASMLAAPTLAAAAEINVYTTREPALIAPLLEAYTKSSGTKVNTVFMKDGLAERVASEGASSPADILMAEDDPVIPFAHFQAWQLPALAHLETARWGGHCGFIENAACDGFGERWVTARLLQDV